MSQGLLALLDDVVSLAKVAAASLDDAAAQAGKAGAKAAGVVVDDAAVTPRYVVGFTADRELPIIARITVGSLRNKLLILLPAALLLSLFAPWAITPLLMAGGLFLCYEGAEKVIEALFHHATGDDTADVSAARTAKELEEEKIRSAVRTDLILSGEIMAITLSTVAAETPSFWMQAAILAVVGIGITLVVYGAVAIIVKADDAGLLLARTRSRLLQVIGRGLVTGMPKFLKLLSIVGTAAMLWVGGGILVHGLEQYGADALGHGIAGLAAGAAQAVPAIGAVLGWLVSAGSAGIGGLATGLAVAGAIHYGIAPAVARFRKG
ncbi:DUF808 domain-containing protein [Novispirillum itersonii]|uniref:ABC transporter n=1 Tax=Novispirillum itersonii TaxID=189 RepID=A0A7W9ZGB5_NOVIT|nr:DUF808 domain-containing protein [Novispirillum itersonii]MBB6210982.1 hypothetical protein [Novispirillum itersonii]